LNSLLGLDVHTERTITMIEDELLGFGATLKINCLLLLKTYHWCSIFRTMLIILPIHPPWKASRKTGTFQRHTFGNTHCGTSKWKVLHTTTAHNYSMHPNEKLHSPLKTTCLLRLNRKDVAVQVSRCRDSSLYGCVQTI
jgi:hypothetical protein